MASTVFSFAGDDNESSGSEHEHWPDDFKKRSTPAVASAGYDSHNGLRMFNYQPAAAATVVSAPSTKADSPSPPPSEAPEKEKSVKLTELPAQYAFAPPTFPAPTKPVKMGTHHAPAPAAEEPKPAAAVPNTYTYHPTFSAKPAAPVTNKWQGRTKAEVEEDNQKIASDEKVWEKRKVVPVGLANDQMLWVVDGEEYTLRTFAAIKDLTGDWKKDPRYEDSWYLVVEKGDEK